MAEGDKSFKGHGWVWPRAHTGTSKSLERVRERQALDIASSLMYICILIFFATILDSWLDWNRTCAVWYTVHGNHLYHMPLIDEWNSQIQGIYRQHLKKNSFRWVVFLETWLLDKCLQLLLSSSVWYRYFNQFAIKMKEGNNFTLSLFLQTSWNVVVLGLYIVHQCSVATVHDLYIKNPQKLHVNMISPVIFLKQTKNIEWKQSDSMVPSVDRRFYP